MLPARDVFNSIINGVLLTTVNSFHNIFGYSAHKINTHGVSRLFVKPGIRLSGESEIFGESLCVKAFARCEFTYPVFCQDQGNIVPPPPIFAVSVGTTFFLFARTYRLRH